MSPRARSTSGWSAGDVVRTTAIVVAVVAGAVALWAASTVVLTVFFGVLFGLALSTGVDWLEHRHVPRGVGAPLVMIVALAILTAIGALIAPTLASQGSELRMQIPAAIGQLQTLLTSHIKGFSIGDVGNQLTAGVGALGTRLFGFLGSTIEVIVYVLLVLFVAVYIAADPELYQTGLMHLVPHRARHRTRDVLSGVANALRQWLLTQFIAMVVLGTVWAIALSILHVKAALALAIIAGLLEFIPTIGPTLAVMPALAMAVIDSPTKALSVLLCYLVIQAIESNVLIPLLMQGRINLPPAVTVVWQALMTLAFGFLGLMVAVPILAAVMVGIKLLYVEDVVGDELPDVDRVVAEARSG